MILHIYFDSKPKTEDLLKCFREAAVLLKRQKEPLLLREERTSRLPDKSGQGQAHEVVWTAPGIRLRQRVTTGKGDARAGFLYDVSFVLELDSGTRLDVQSESSDAVTLREVLVRLAGVTPEQFGSIRDIFRRHLGLAADQTDSVWITTINAEAALKSGHGAFARSLLDRGKALYPTIAEVAPDQQEYWWPRFRELARKLDEALREPDDH